MSKDIKSEYERVQIELNTSQREISGLEQRKTNLLHSITSLGEIEKLNNQIQQLKIRINELTPEYTRLQAAYNESLHLNLNLNAQKNNLQKAIKTSQELSSIYDDFFNSIDSILEQYSEFEGQQIDTTEMVIKIIPKTEILNSAALKEACKQQSQKAFDELLSKMEDINAQNSKGMTLLMYSLKHGFWYGVEKLLERVANVDLIDNNGCNALVYACTLPHMKYILKIVENTSAENINIQIPKNGYTALHCLLNNIGVDKVYSDEISIIQQTKGAGGVTADLFITGSLILTEDLTFSGQRFGGLRHDGFSLNQQRALVICKALKDKGFNFVCKDNVGLTPYFFACRNQQKYLVTKLQNECFNLNELDNTGFQGAAGFLLLNDLPALKNYIQTHPLALQDSDGYGDTLLHYAVKLNNLSILQLLLTSGANPNLQDAQGLTPLYLACMVGNIEVLTILKNSGANVNILNNAGYHPIHAAIHNGHTQIVEELLKSRVNIDTKSISGYTPLQYYCELPNNNLQVVKFLISKGSRLDCTQGENLKPLLHSAVISNNIEVVEFLLEKGASVNVLSSDKISSLYASLGYYNQPISLEMLQLLINKGADVNEAMFDGDTPMHMTGYRARADIMKILHSHGANINAVNQDGKTPLNLIIEWEGQASHEQKVVAAKYLLSCGGVVGKGHEQPKVVEFLQKVASFNGDDNLLTQQTDIIELLQQANLALSPPSTDIIENPLINNIGDIAIHDITSSSLTGDLEHLDI